MTAITETKTHIPALTIFRAYDIRGIVDSELTQEGMQLIGTALGNMTTAKGKLEIAVARDGRLSGPMLLKGLIKGLREAGLNVTDIGSVPTPVLYFAAHQLHAQSGAMLTGSHNPANYNGLKMMVAGETLAGESIQALYQSISDETLHTAAEEGSYRQRDMSNAYMQAITNDIQMGKRPLKIVIDCGNGITGPIAPKLYEYLGCEVIALYAEVDGNFPNHHPDPSDPHNLQDLIEAVKANQADIGLAFDGDGDRLGVVTNEGTIIWPDRLMMLFAEEILKKRPGAQFIYDVKCSRHLQSVIEQHGGSALMWKTGHSFIKAKLKETKAALAGEMSGHFFFNDRWFGFDDGIYAGARLLEILSHTSLSTEEIFQQYPNSVNTPELKVPVSESDKYALIEKIVVKANFGDAPINALDGLRVDTQDGFGLVRASNTTPYLICRFEAGTIEALAKIQAEFKALFLSIDSTLAIPF